MPLLLKEGFGKLCAAAVDKPRLDFVTDLLLRLFGDGRTKAREQSSSTSRRLQGTEREPQEVELLVRMILLPVRVLALGRQPVIAVIADNELRCFVGTT